jgi:hypothetical protein
MRQRFRLLVTVSRTWDDARTIEQALALGYTRDESSLTSHPRVPESQGSSGGNA